MDTRFWGPDGWILFHSIAEGYPSKPTKENKTTYENFFKTIEHVLPCIYCRRSFSQYLKEAPIRPYLKSKKTLIKWLHLMHNKVNDKLRKQGLNELADPELAEISTRYRKYVKDINKSNCIGMPGWDFLYSIVFNFPLNKRDLETERFYQHVIFFKYLSKVLPFKVFREKYTKYVEATDFEKVLTGRESCINWLYTLEKSIKKLIACKCLNYSKRCEIVEVHRAGCGGKSDKKPTCRVGNSK